MSNVAVLSSRSQYDFFVKNYDPVQFTVLCDNPGFSEFLASKKIKHTLLTEFLLADQWAEVNAWACARAAAWPDSCKMRGLFKEFDYPRVLFHYFSHVLTQMLKNFLYAQYICQTFAASRIVLFGPPTVGFDYPQYDGNFFLNYFLREECEKTGISYDWCHAAAKARSRYSAESSSQLSRTIKLFFKKIFMGLLGGLNDLEAGAQVLVSGSLRHLSAVLLGLKAKRQKIVFLDDIFQFKKFFFALRNRIPYRIIEQPFSATSPLAGAFQYFLAEAKNALVLNSAYFVFRGRDFSNFIFSYIFERMEKYFLNIEITAAGYIDLLKKNNIKALVVEEDYAKGSFLAVFMTHYGVKSFCVSHANVPVDFCVPANDQRYGNGITFVNSEFEKAMYEARGWDGSRIIVSGVPRYDRLLRLQQKSGISGRHRSMRILVCGGPWWPHTPDELGYLGLHIECYRELQSAAMRELFAVTCESSSFELIVKPHHIESEPYWKSFLHNQTKVGKVRLLRSTEDIFRLLMQCDAMVLSYWSTAIIEAALVKLPVIFLNIRPTVSPVLSDFSRKSFCCIAHDRSEIQSQLSILMSKRQDPPLDPQVAKYYLGTRDAQATRRVVCEILRFSNLAHP